MTDVYWLVLGSVAVWRLTHLLSAEDGPGQLIAKLRGALDRTVIGGLLGCLYCLSLWVALPLALVLGGDSLHRLLLWPALSGGAILLERLTRRELPLAYVEAAAVDATDPGGFQAEDAYVAGSDDELLWPREDASWRDA